MSCRLSLALTLSCLACLSPPGAVTFFEVVPVTSTFSDPVCLYKLLNLVAIQWTHLRIFFIVILLRSNPSADQLVSDSLSQSKKVISRSGNISILYKRVMKMPVESLLQISDICNLSNASNADLLTTITISLRFGHFKSWCATIVTIYCHLKLNFSAAFHPSLSFLAKSYACAKNWYRTSFTLPTLTIAF